MFVTVVSSNVVFVSGSYISDVLVNENSSNVLSPITSGLTFTSGCCHPLFYYIHKLS